MNIDALKSERELVKKRAQELINEQLRLEGEYRRLDLQISMLDNEGSEAPASETVVENPDGSTTQTS